MRIAYVGLSTPLFYDYRTPVQKAPSDLISSPNPILDNPFGLMLLFDEIWFACRSLCPENMRELPYVKFLDEKKMLPPLTDVYTNIASSIESDPQIKERYDNFIYGPSPYEHLVEKMINWDAAPDNHTHRLKLGNMESNGNSLSLDTLLFDMGVVQRLGNDIELITNSFSQRWFESNHNPFIETKLAEIMLIDSIPNFLTANGPYHPCIDEGRDDSFLKDFRKWVSKQSGEVDDEEIYELKRQVNEEIQKLQNELFLKFLDPKTQYKSSAKILLGASASVITGLPIDAAVAMTEQFVSFFKNKERRWQGFVVSSRNWDQK